MRDVECGYAWDDDDECSGPSCMLEKGHTGPHQATWETRPLDICLAQGHLWDLWQTYDPAIHFGASIDWKVPPTRERECLRCGRHDIEGGERNPDISDILMRSILGYTPGVKAELEYHAEQRLTRFSLSTDKPYAGGITWVEDRLNPRPWRPE